VRARHKYSIRRPRALLFSYRSQVIHHGDESGVPGSHVTASALAEDVAKERERLDLFIDLIWVGIISNLSEVYSSIAFRAENPNAGEAFVRIPSLLIVLDHFPAEASLSTSGQLERRVMIQH
jgi:hypothetical protein